MTAFAIPTIERTSALVAAAGASRPWWRRLQRLFGSDPLARARGLLRSLKGNRRGEPVYRITRVWMDRWVVLRPGASMEHAFSTLGEAAAFVRHEAGWSPVTVELFIGDLYVAAYHDPNRPKSLFGEAV
ncbi:MAG TPA: hypothetical protein VLX09_09040 [Stellaceae bacterium]|nr:hypothetical protein [Stellaceae bacterium]